MLKLTISGYVVFLLALVVYSYSQIDLNLTLSSWGPYQYVQQQLIQLGYFNRPLSTNLYLILIAGLFLFWLYFLRLAFVGLLSNRGAFKLVLLSAGILLFSYPAFSHDVFNYMFDARIMTTYGQNPYTHRALDFPQDQWLRFMHWTHRYSPYGPVWLAVSAVPSLLGGGKFVLTLFGFKLLAASSHVTSAWFAGRVVSVRSPRLVPAAMILLGLYPLLLVESVVSAHNDVVMMVGTLASIWFLLRKRRALSLLLLGLSVGIKYVTVMIAPLWLVFVWKRLSVDQFAKISVTLLLSGIGIVVAQIFNKGATGAEFHPWFLVWPLSAAALLPRSRWLHAGLACLALGLLLRYVPFLLVGEYPVSVQQTKTLVTIAGGILGAILALIVWRRHARG